jgi:formamidopyrimidine-DNA glycosylase
MPELPEVESLAAFLRGHATGHAVARADAASFSVLKTFDPPLTDLSGQVITEVGRHGKFLDLATDQGLHLIMHLARAGWLRWRDDLPTAPPKPGKSPLAFRLRLDDGSGFDLTEQGSHKRLAVYLVRDPAEVPGVATLGPDPLAADFTRDTLASLLAGRRMQVKGVLRDQRIIAGIGNAYSDEILHAARLSPFKMADKITDDELLRLHAAIRETLTGALDRQLGQRAATLKGEKRAGLQVHARTGLPCPVCGDTVREVSFADTSLQYCPTCQTGGKPLADRRLSRLLK